MTGEIEALVKARGGACSARELLEVGVSRVTIEVAVRKGTVTRLRRDSLVLTALLDGAAPWERQVLTARAVGASLASTGSVHALSHSSALMVMGLPYLANDGLVHLVRTDGQRGRRDAHVFVHRPVDACWARDVEGLRVVEPALAALQVAAADGAEAGVVALDGVLRRSEEADLGASGDRRGPERARVIELVERALEQGFGNSTGVVNRVAEAADGRSESVGESRSRWWLLTLGWSSTPQVEIRDEHGVFVARVDLLLDGWPIVVEFDGAGKYTGPGALLAEKERERRLRTLGYEVVRLTWADLDRPALIRQRILEAIALVEARAA